jgi:DNA-binding transcriptional LysR family regulator
MPVEHDPSLAPSAGSGDAAVRIALRRLTCFVATAEALSYWRAATRLGAQPAWVSKQVHALEAAIGTELLAQQGSRLALTEPGRTLLRRAGPLIEAELRLAASFEAVARAAAGTVVVVAPPTTSTLAARNALLGRFVAEAGDFDVEAREATTPAVVRAVRRGEADLGLALRPFDESGLRVRMLHRAEHALILPPDHPLASREQIHLSDLEGVRVTAFDRSANPGLFDGLYDVLEDFGAHLVPVPEMHPRAHLEAVRTDGLVCLDLNRLVASSSAIAEHPPLVVRPVRGLEGVSDLFLVARRQPDHPAVDIAWRIAEDLPTGDPPRDRAS